MKHSHQGISSEELSKLMEPIIRKVVREELNRMIEMRPDIFYLQPEMPIYDDMLDILERKSTNSIHLHSHKEAYSIK